MISFSFSACTEDQRVTDHSLLKAITMMPTVGAHADKPRKLALCGQPQVKSAAVLSAQHCCCRLWLGEFDCAKVAEQLPRPAEW